MFFGALFEMNGSIVDHVRYFNSHYGHVISKSVFDLPQCSVGFAGYQVQVRGRDWARGVAFFEVLDLFGNADRGLVLVGERKVLIQILPTTRLEEPGLDVDFDGGEICVNVRGSFKVR